MKNKRIPKARFQSEPFINGFTDIEKNNIDITIGLSDKPEDIFFGNNNDYIDLICEITSKSEFKSASVNAEYIDPDSYDDICSCKTMSYKLYDGSFINMEDMVSKISIDCIDVNFNSNYDLYSSIYEKILKNKTIYEKYFGTQSNILSVGNITNKLSADINEIIHPKSHVYLFAGKYYDGIKISDIQQYLFYIGLGKQSSEYIRIISAVDLFPRLKSGELKLCSGVCSKSLSTLEDDIYDGKIILSIDGHTEYTSFSMSKTTVLSSKFHIFFKRIN